MEGKMMQWIYVIYAYHCCVNFIMTLTNTVFNGDQSPLAIPD